MPRREDIQKFAQILNSLGDEPAIRAARSETIEETPPPGEETPEAGPADFTTAAAPVEGAGTEEQEGLQDIFESLSGLPEEGAAETGVGPRGPAAAEGAEAEGPAGPAPEGLDLSSLFGDDSAPPDIEDLDRPAPAQEAPAAPEAGPLPAPEEEFTFPEGEPTGLQSDLSQMEVIPEEPGAPAPEEVTPAPEAAFEDFGTFPQEPTAEPAETAETGMEGLELPNLDDLSFAEPGQASAPAAEEEQPAAPPAQEEAAPLPGFDLDTAAFGEPAAAAPSAPEEMPAPEPSAPEPSEPAPAPGMESLGEEALGDLNLDEFSLPESAEQFGEPEARPEAPPPAPAARKAASPAAAGRAAREREAPRRKAPPPRPVPVGEEAEAAAGEFSLTPAQFAQLKKALEALPRNLKIAVQDIVGDGTAAGADLARLVDLLLGGASAQEIATLAGRISGKRIRIPAGYEKRTGAAFEAEQRTFAYAFRENFLPLVRVVALTLLAGGIFGFLGFRYVYRPLAAYSNYRAGYTQIARDAYTLANERFSAATRIWPMKSWYSRFAEAFADKRQYVLAEEKYEQLLRQFGEDRTALLQYARMETYKLADYEKADGLLQRILDRKRDDYDALLAAGDNDIEWAASSPGRYEEARVAYATLISVYGAKDDLLFRMLRYFIRTDTGDEVERLRSYYAARPDIRINADVYAELGGYLVDHRRLDYAQDVLFRADSVDPTLYEIHYNLARYYRIVSRPADEKAALDHVVRLLALRPGDALTPRRLTVEIDTHTRLGEYYYATQEYIRTGNELQNAISLIESNQRMKLLGKQRIFGRAYADLGDLYYYVQGDLASAAVEYRAAIDNRYTSPLLTYKIGYIQYNGGDYKSALATFIAAEDASAYPSGNEAEAPATDQASTAPAALPAQVPENLLYSLGNSFFQRGDFFAAQGYYLRLLSRLETRRENLGTLHPEDRPDDRALLDTLVKVNNNLGVTMRHLGERTGDRKKSSEALVYLTSATEIDDSLARNLSSAQRSPNPSLASLNMRGILYPASGFVLQPYATIPKDFQATTW